MFVKEIGAILRHAREEKNMSIQHLHERTRIRAGLIEAIEEGRFEEVPSGEVYLRGFLRNLCTELDVDYGQVLALMPKPSTTAKDEPVRLTRTKPRKRFKPAVLVALVLLLALTGVGVWVFINRPLPDVPPIDGSVIIDPVVQDPVLDPVGELPAETPAEEEPESTVTLLSETSEKLTYEISQWPVSLQLSIKSERCWVRIITDGNTLEERIWSPGESKEFLASNTLTMRLGLASAAEIAVNGVSLGTQTGYSKDYVFLKPSP